MVRLRSRLAVKHLDDNRLLIQSNPSRRIMFGAICAVLVLAFAFGIDWQTDTGRQLVTGLIFYFSLTVITLVVAAWNKTVTVDTGSEREIRFVNTLFGIPVRRSRVGIDEVSGVILQKVKLIGRSDRPRSALGTSPFGAAFSRRGNYCKLYLETGDTRLFVEDSTYMSELEGIGTALATSIGVSLSKEDL